MQRVSRFVGSWPEITLRAVLGGAIGAALALCGIAVGYLRAFMAPGQERYIQAVLRPGAGWTTVRYAFAFVATGVLLGILWPLGRHSLAARILVGAAVGATFASLVIPPMDASLPNWPTGPAPPAGPHGATVNAILGALFGAVIAWRFPRRSSSEAESASPTA